MVGLSGARMSGCHSHWYFRMALVQDKGEMA